MKILVTGGGGFLGKSIIKTLQTQGITNIVSFSRNSYPELGVSCIQGDLRSEADLKKALQGVETIFHVAALAGVWGKKEDFFNINYHATCLLLKLSKACGVKKFIYTSTPSVVFGKKSLRGVDENTPYPKKYLCDYAESKAWAEQAVLKANDSQNFLTVALRPHLIYGPGDPHLIPKLIETYKRRKLFIVGNGKNKVDVTHVENAARAHYQVFKHLETDAACCGKSYFIGDGEPVYLWKFIDQILAEHGFPPMKKKMPFEVAYSLGWMIEKIYSMLRIYNSVPPMTRFVALQLAKDHYFSQVRAKLDFKYGI